MKNKLKVSVIVAVYNAEKFIEKCMDSIVSQTLKEIEIIVMNDGSTDNTKEKLKKYERNERVIIINKENEGSTKSRNKALKMCQGKYIIEFDGDDYLEDNKALEILYEECEKNNFDILMFDYYKEDILTGKKEYCSSISLEEKEVSKYNYILDMLNHNGDGMWCKIHRRDIIEKNNIFFLENLFSYGDTVFSIETGYYSNKIGKINKAFYNYVQHKNQITKNVSIEKVAEAEYIQLLELEKLFLKKEDPNWEEYLKVVRLKIYYFYLKGKNKNLPYYQEIKKRYLKENKKWLFDSKYYKSWILKNKIKFFIRCFFVNIK